MTLSGTVFTTNAGLPEADAMQVFVHMHIAYGFDLLFIGVPGRLCLPEKKLVSPFGLGGNESHLVRQVYTNTKDLCKSQDGNTFS